MLIQVDLYNQAVEQLGFTPQGLDQWSIQQLQNLIYWLSAGVEFRHTDKNYAGYHTWTANDILNG